MKRKASNQGQQGKPKLQRQGAVYGEQALTGRRPSSAQLALLGEEVHFFDKTISDDATTTSVVLPLNTVVQGDTVADRQANKILMKALEIRILYSNEAITQNNRIRLLVVVDKQPNGAQCALSDVLEAEAIQAFPKVANKSRFKIIMDEVIVLNQSSSNAGGFEKGFFHKYIRIKPDLALSTFASSATAVPITNSLSIFYLGDVAAGATDVDMTVNCRLSFLS